MDGSGQCACGMLTDVAMERPAVVMRFRMLKSKLISMTNPLRGSGRVGNLPPVLYFKLMGCIVRCPTLSTRGKAEVACCTLQTTTPCVRHCYIKAKRLLDKNEAQDRNLTGVYTKRVHIHYYYGIRYRKTIPIMLLGT